MSDYVPVKVRGVYFVSTITGPQAVVFIAADNERMVPIYIGLAEAISIDIALRQETTPRPMTHDLMKTMMDSFNIKIDRIIIDDLDEQVFYARLMLKDTGREIEIDARPSDCIALAVRMNASIFIDPEIFDKVAVDRKDIEAAGNLEEFFE
ncbi:MAG TPA: bifunctional nuclease family protein [Methanocella sp.]|uniref:bifunctional nuclease family protein n=1 Tax=Methanocella sp. TaxID=2052833 RepID=UPI002C029DDE|nr:bifunctional nuclease family protein [Methanocella sp.]HTY90526.1 bifunctional nuclease family protein [Methanocella sp.]